MKGQTTPNGEREAALVKLETAVQLSRRTLHLAFVWNDHNFRDAAHVMARKEAEKAGIADLDASNDYLDKLDAAIALLQSPAAPAVAVYGYCPTCGAAGERRERRADGNDNCENGHTYPSRNATASPKSPAAVQQGEAAHRDDVAVDLFAAAMKAKMAKQRAKGYGGWDNPMHCEPDFLRERLAAHIAKGDPVDVGNFAMMLFNRNESTAPSPASPEVGGAALELTDSWRDAMFAKHGITADEWEQAKADVAAQIAASVPPPSAAPETLGDKLRDVKRMLVDAPAPVEALVDRDALADAAFVAWRDTPGEPFPGTQHPKWLAVVDTIAALLPSLPAGVDDTCHGLDTPERVRFYERDFYPLSNFSAFKIDHWGLPFDTSEAAYHWMKFADTAPAVAEEIRLAPSAHEAFKIAERNKGLRRADWDNIKLNVMRGILRSKVTQHEYVYRKLLATGDRELVEDSWRDDYWGWGPNRDGQNWLGRLWMELREQLRTAALATSRTQEKSL